METFKDFLGEINALNIAMIAFALFAGGIWYKGREKLRQIGELFLAAHEYTDDKRLSRTEREDLMRRFMELIGRPVAPSTEQPEAPQQHTSEKAVNEKRRAKNRRGNK